MSEMLGHYYFMSRNFGKAAEAFIEVLSENPENIQVKKRMIICYIHLGKVNQAFDLFYEVISIDPNIIINTDTVADDCPCPELISKYGEVTPNSDQTYNMKLILSMLWLFCNSQISIDFFKSLSKDKSTTDERINKTIELIENALQQKNKSSN